MNRAVVKRVGLYAGVTVAVLGLLSLVAWFSFPAMARWYLRSKVIPRYEKRLGRDIRVEKIVVTRGHVQLEGLSVHGPADAPEAPLFSAARIDADFDFWGAVKGDMTIGAVSVERPQAALVVAADGTNNWSDALESWRKSRKPRKDDDGGPRRSRFESAVLTQGRVTIDDHARGLHAQIDEWSASYTPHGAIEVTVTGASATSKLGPSAGIDTFTLTAQADDPRATTRIELEGGRASLWSGFALAGVHGTVAPAEASGGRLLINLSGGYAGAEDTMWRAEGWLDAVQRVGEMHLRADRFTLDKIASVLQGSMVKEPAKAAVSAALDLKLNGDVLDFEGQVEIAGLTVYHAWLADKPVKDLGLVGEVRGRYAQGARVFELDTAAVQFRGVQARLEGYAAFPGGRDGDGALRPKPRLRARLVVPEVPCQKALKALPRELTPKLQGFHLKGKFKTDVAVDIDWADLEALELGGSVGINGCKVEKPRKEMDAELLKEEFEHIVEVEKDRYMKFIVGPTNPDFVPIADVSPHLINSILTTEDGLFYKHHGFITSEFRTALKKNLQAGYFRIGASSITMQFVKNVMLHRQKTLARKLQELFLTWYVEQVLEKDRILEIYFNVIEFGPGIYGIGPAARHYFGKATKDLNPVEAAFFSSILPNPKKRHMQYCDNKLFRWAEEKIKRILKLMHEKERLTDQEYELAQLTPLVFVYPPDFDQKACVKMTQKAIKNARPTTPDARPDDDLDLGEDDLP